MVGAPPCEVGNAMTIVSGGAVRGTLGCAEFDAAAVAAAAEVDRSWGARGAFHHEQGDVEVYLEPHAPASRLLVVSATDVARSLRGDGAPGAAGPPRRAAARASRPDRRAGGRSLDEAAPGPGDEVVFTDHDAPGIADMLASLLRSRVRFVGVMGSRRHVAHYVEDLRSRGFTDEDLERIRAPSASTSVGAVRRRSASRSRRASSRRGTNATAAGWIGDHAVGVAAVGDSRLFAPSYYAPMLVLQRFTPVVAVESGREGLPVTSTSVTVNEELREAEVEPRTLLVYFLREGLGLTGTNVGCDTSSCGSCTVLLDGESVKSCTLLAVQADGRRSPRRSDGGAGR